MGLLGNLTSLFSIPLHIVFCCSLPESVCLITGILHVYSIQCLIPHSKVQGHTVGHHKYTYGIQCTASTNLLTLRHCTRYAMPYSPICLSMLLDRTAVLMSKKESCSC